MGGDGPNSNSSAVAESVQDKQDDTRRECLKSDDKNNNKLQPLKQSSESKNNQLCEDLNDGSVNAQARSVSSTPTAQETIINPDLSTQQQQDWHTEMLCGMFLRSDEKDLECLEHEVIASHNNKPSSSDDIKHPIYRPPTKTEEPEVGVGKNSEEEDTTITPPTNEPTTQQQQLDKFLTDMLNLGQTMDSTVLSLIPEALRGLPQYQSLQQKEQSSNNNNIKSNDKNDETPNNLEGCEVSKEGDSDCNDFNNPLILPPSWKRSDYASRTLPELERYIISLSKRGIRRGFNGTERNGLKTNGKNGLHPSPSKQPGPKTYELFTILYNECSLSAMANWAMLDFSQTSNNRDVNYDEGDKQTWERCKENHEKHRVTNRTQHGAIIPAPMFHLCGVCGGFGHYEVECETLLANDEKTKRKRENNIVATESPDKPRPQKKKRMQHKIVLEEEEKSSIISSLAKEIHIQRMQNQNYLAERKAAYAKNPFHSSGSLTNIATTGGSSVSAASLNTNHTNNKTDGATKDQYTGYTGKSTCCKICLSSVDDGKMLLCDGCDELFHCQCLDPPLDSVPSGDWFCENCSSHDNDASSVVEIEGCGGFIIEQRKQSVAEEEEEAMPGTINLGPTKNFWTSAITLLPEQDPIVEDELYLQKHLGRDSENFFIGETCWAKRFDQHLGRVVWWPGMVSDVETRTLKRINCVKTTYTVLFFALDEERDIHETEMLPFFPYYEDIGHKRLMRCDNLVGHDLFRRALMLCVATLGLKSLSQALKFARKGIQMAAVMNNEYRCLLPPGWKTPVGWENAEIDNIDGIVILAKTGGEQITTDNASPEKKPPSEVDQQLIDNSTDDSRSHRMVSQFTVDELIGGIVSWQSDVVAPETNNVEELEIQYGIVVSLDTETEMALVRIISMLCGNLDELFHNVSTNGLVIHASDLGATTWIPLKRIRFVASKPSLSDLGKFKTKLKANMRNEMESFHKQIKRDARFRETVSLELEDIPLEERLY